MRRRPQTKPKAYPYECKGGPMNEQFLYLTSGGPTLYFTFKKRTGRYVTGCNHRELIWEGQ